MPSRVSTEVDARLSFDTAAALARAHRSIVRHAGARVGKVGQIVALAGCDPLTISPELLAPLQASDAPVAVALDADAAAARQLPLPAAHHDEKRFRWAMSQDAMATEKLAEGICAFAADAAKLDQLIEAAP